MKRLNRLVTVKVAARILRASKSTVYNLCQSGELPTIAVGLKKGLRIDVADLEAFLARRRRDDGPAAGTTRPPPQPAGGFTMLDGERLREAWRSPGDPARR